MKFFIALIAIMAATIVNAALAPDHDVPAVPENPEQAWWSSTDHVLEELCKKCDDEFSRCHREWACWFDPVNCDTRCAIQVCHFDKDCKEKCGWDKC
ncbi:hypothetical protein CC80DRAFT_598530 [Byssothecium circinans]|uniref:Uncharacterized protein n=1 Tax=Byssothecium circinans TaxID=147558 RepID=A0A6A5TAC2_9PLEO|nr:hypothetical protein CC80DRAFT_598530 [Byssothecium circinans]